MNALRKSMMVTLVAVGCCLTFSTGCDLVDYVMPGDFFTPSVEPMDFSPYGYDYDMYDIFTEDI